MKPISFGRYILLQKLAMGGTAEIFKAKLLGVEGFEKEVVIKRILAPWSANPHFISMLIDEAKILVKMQHEKIVQVYELGRENELYYISMEYIKGWDLRHIIRDAQENSKPFQISECIFVMGEILKGLDYIHRQTDKQGHNLEIVHRDISPQNILISTEGKIKIADFGIAHARSRSYETSTGVIKGKFSYMSPEQARADSVNFKTDIFATGILFYEMLTLQKLFRGKSDIEVLNQVRDFKPEKIIQNLNVPSPLLKVLKRSLADQMSYRYSSAQEFLKDFQEAAKVLKEDRGEEIFLKRLQKLPSPEKEDVQSPLPNFELGQTQAIVSRECDSSDTDHEITRSLENMFVANTDRNPSLTPISQTSPKRGLFILSATLVIFLSIFLSWFTYKHLPPKQTKSLVAAPLESPKIEAKPSEPTLIATETKVSEKIPETKTSKPLPIPLQKGSLSVRAMPWGKISVSGVASNVEKPLLRTLDYGNYQIRVSYQNDEGIWSQVSKSVKISKPVTQCSASFQKNGQGTLNCQ